MASMVWSRRSSRLPNPTKSPNRGSRRPPAVHDRQGPRRRCRSHRVSKARGFRSRQLHTSSCPATSSIAAGEAEVIAPLLEVISVKEGYGEVAEYLLSDVVVVRDLRAGLSLWNRNGFYSTLVTPDGEVIDPMGTVSGGSDDALDGNSSRSAGTFES